MTVNGRIANYKGNALNQYAKRDGTGNASPRGDGVNNQSVPRSS